MVILFMLKRLLDLLLGYWGFEVGMSEIETIEH
jgi:hypothetical protein